MRIVGGSLKGWALKSPDSDMIRPTSDRLRETIFNILAHSYGNPVAGARVIDLFAGTGAMALEALSRGADSAFFLDQSANACAIIRDNLATLDLGRAARILRRDARNLGPAPEGENFNLAFLDPPYGKDFVAPTLNALREGSWLGAGAVVVIEERAGAEVNLPDGFALRETRRYGVAQVVFACFN